MRDFHKSELKALLDDLRDSWLACRQQYSLLNSMDCSDDSDDEMVANKMMLQDGQLQLEQQLLDDDCHYMLVERYPLGRTITPFDTAFLSEVLPFCSDKKFRFHTRMDRGSFGVLVKMLHERCNHIFCNNSNCPQLTVSVQLHLALFCLGFYGNGASFEAAAEKYKLSVGMILNARERVCTAFSELMNDFITWPGSEERRCMCEFVRKNHGYKSCFFATDGTTHPLSYAPSFQKESFFDRKKRYSIHALVTNDFKNHVIDLVVGWPGSAHDSRVISQASFYNGMDDPRFFSNREHGLGDAAFKATRRLVPTYKKPAADLPENTFYNYKHSSLRMTAEHTIGLVKNRFQGLREIRIKVGNKRTLTRAITFITSAYVIHNILLRNNDAWTLDDAGGPENCSNSVGEGSNGEDSALADDEDGDLLRESVKEEVLSYHGYV